MINLISILILAFTFVISGFFYAKLSRTNSYLEHLSLSFIIGSGLATFFWFAIYLLGYPLDLFSFFLSALISFVLGFTLTSRIKSSLAYSPHKLSIQEKYLFSGVITLIVLALITSSYNPVISWDSLTLYDFRGMVIAKTSSLSGLEFGTYYLSYPLMTSLTHAVVYLLGGNNPQTFYSLIYLSLLGVIYGRMSGWTNRKYALITTLLVATSPYLWEHATISYTNLPYAAFFVAGLLYLPSTLVLGGSLVGLSIWTRTAEPFWLASLPLIIYFGWKNKQLLSAISGTALVFVFRLVWNAYHASAYLRGGLESASSDSIYNLEIFGKILNNLGSIMSYISQFIITPYLGIWLMTAFSLTITIISRRNLARQVVPTALLIALLLIAGMVVAGIAIFSTYYSSWYSIGGSATRMLIFIIPLAAVVGIQVLYLGNQKNAQK
jgi:hypothetical protein